MWKKKVLRAGKVLEVGAKKIKVELFSKELPAVCQTKGCTACLSYSPQTVRNYRKNDFENDVLVGDVVKVGAWQINDGTAAAALFMIPILFSAVFYHISTVAGVSQESILSIFFAVLGGIFGFGITVSLDKIFRKINPTKIFKE